MRGGDPARQGGDALTKWYFAINEAGLERVRNQIHVAVQSCREVAGLLPHCLYSGEDVSRLDDLRELGVTVIPHRPLLEKELREGYGDEKYEVFCGHWLRGDLPLIETQEKYILYTDVDVMFRRPFDGLKLPEKAVAAAPEQQQREKRYFNSGVLVMNLPVMRDLLPAFHETIRARLKNDFTYPPHDQGSFNAFYHDKMEWLPVEMNWKPYWGENPQAQIVHFHGPKPRQIDRFKAGIDERRPALQALWARNPAAYDVYVAEFDAWLREANAARRKARRKMERRRLRKLAALAG